MTGEGGGEGKKGREGMMERRKKGRAKWSEGRRGK